MNSNQTQAFERKLSWIQCVASKSGGEPHLVRCFDGGLLTCDCEGFNWRGKCSHIAAGKLQQAREALAAKELLAAVEQPAPRARVERRQEASLPPTYRAAGFRRAESAAEAFEDLFGSAAA